ncbi:GNAT family N-acetyltransferase [Paraglaciecola aestuariivivens]
MSIKIRKEQAVDKQSIFEVITAAFVAAPYSNHSEQFIVNELRASGALSISLVAEVKGKIVGHVALSAVCISDGTRHWFGLGPISVHPDKQNEGIGSMLMRAAIAELQHIGANGCVLLGEPSFYRRFGFESKPGLILADVPPEYFQALLLKGELPQGRVTYHQAFSTKG